MNRHCRWMVVALIMLFMQLSACGPKSVSTTSENEPARVEPIAGTRLSRVILTAQAARRLDIQIVLVRVTQVGGPPRKVIPYAALLYDSQGDTWVYTNPEPLHYVRQPVSVDHIDGDLAVLLEGPPAGMAVVTVGAAELFGAEFGVGA